jgi:hypothetical protein
VRRGTDMALDLFNPYLLALLGVGYVFVSAVCATLSGAIRNETERHNLIREARLRRSAYLQQLAQRGQPPKA